MNIREVCDHCLYVHVPAGIQSPDPAVCNVCLRFQFIKVLQDVVIYSNPGAATRQLGS